MITDEDIKKDIVKDEKILGIFRTIHSRIIQMDIDIKNFVAYDDVVKDKNLLEKFYKAMRDIYREIHDQLSAFSGAKHNEEQKKVYETIIKSLKDFEKKTEEYSAYIGDMEKAFKEPLDKKRFERDYEVLNTIYNEIRKDEDIAEKFMKILQTKS